MELRGIVSSKGAKTENPQAAAEMKRMIGNSFNRSAEDITQPYISTRPKKRAEHIEKEKSRRSHVKNARQRRSNAAQAGHKFRKHQRPRTLFREKTLCAPHAGIRLKRNFAEKLKNLDAAHTSPRAPNAATNQRGEDT